MALQAGRGAESCRGGIPVPLIGQRHALAPCRPLRCAGGSGRRLRALLAPAAGACAPRQLAGRRRPVEVAARPRKAEDAGGADGDVQGEPRAFSKLTVAELRAECQQRGLPSTGKKADLVTRLVAWAAEQGGGGGDDEAAAAAPAAADGGDDVPLEELVAELRQELQQYSKAQLVECLQDRGIKATGSKQDLVDRLAPVVARETLVQGEEEEPPPPPQQQPQAAAAEPGAAAAAASDVPAEAAPAPQPPAGSAAADERKWLVADKQQAMLEELLRMEPEREELLEILAEMGQTVEDDESLEEMAERASWLLAEEEVLMLEQRRQQEEQQQQQPGGAGAAPAGGDKEALAASPSSVLDGVTATDINKMKVDDLREYLRKLGLSTEGSRYVLRDRLMAMLVVRRAASAGDMDQLLAQLSQMTLGELRSELEVRRLSLAGSKAALEMRLAQALAVELLGPEAAGMLGTPAGAEEAEQAEGPESPLLEDYDEAFTAATDPAVRVALVCGTAGAPDAGAPAAARLERGAAALASAAALVDELHTAPLDDRQAAAMAAAAQGERPVPACGVSVDVYWASSAGGPFYQVPRTALAGLGPADLPARAPALASATLADAAALAAHLAAAGTHAALSLLPGGALALGGKLAEALAAAGVPLAAGGPLPDLLGEPGEGEQQPLPPPLQAAPAELQSRAGVLRRLRALGYPALPALELQRGELEAAAGELEAWLDARAERAADALAQLAAAEEAEGAGVRDDDETGGAAAGSALLRAWAGQPDEPSKAAGEEQQQEQGQEQEQQKPPPLVERLAAWCEREGFNPDLQLFALGSSQGGEPLAAARGVDGLARQLLATLRADASLPGVLAEPLYRKLTRWEVVVVASPEDGPVALVPAELEQHSVVEEIRDADLALQEWQMMQAGLEDGDIVVALEQLAADEPPPADVLRLPAVPDPLPHNTLRLHMPPRASTKLTQTIRHAAAKAVSQLGLDSAGLVRVGGWLAARPGWEQGYELGPEELKQVPDFDAGHVRRMREEEAARRAGEPSPLSEYYDETTHMPDLGLFDPARRCSTQGNGEGEVLLRSVDLDVALHASSLAGLQAAEVGLGVGGLARHLINLALMRARSGTLLPLAPPPATESSALWAQASGANDSLRDIELQQALQAVERRTAEGNVREKAEEVAERKAFAALPLEQAISDVLRGLSPCLATREELAGPAEEPEEWQPEVDGRTQEEIAAERDARRAPEELAARALRDEGLFHYGDTPIAYSRWDDLEGWVPPGIEQAQAAAEGRPVPTMAELAERERAKEAEQRQALLGREYGPEDAMPDASEDEVLVGRLLGHDRYAGGVTATLQRRAREAREDTGGAVGRAAAAALEATAPPGGDNLEALEHWPWPADREVLDEAAWRRAAPRVWVLMGGDGLGRQAAFRSGANVVAKLQRCCDLQVDAFLLPPSGGGLDEARRRKALLERRTEWRALGIPEAEFPGSMSDAALIDMPPSEAAPLRRQVVVASPQQLGRHSVEEAAEAAERLAARCSVSYHAARVLPQQQLDAQYDAQAELAAHWVEGVGRAWAGEASAMPPPPRFMDLEEFVLEAAAVDAVVLLALSDSTAASGQLQQLLEAAGVGYTGMASDFAFKCGSRLALAKAVDDLTAGLSQQAAQAAGGARQGEPQQDAEQQQGAAGASVGLLPVPKKVLKSRELLDCLARPAEFDSLFEALLEGWERATAIAVKPEALCGGAGVVRVGSGSDLAALAGALAASAPRLPAGALGGQQLPAALPLHLPELLVVEPWVETDAVTFGPGGEAQWAGNSRWVEVSVGLLSELGLMSALQPTLVCHSPEGIRHQLTPAPEHILPPAAAEAVKGFAVALADGLGLRSVASISGFVNVDTCELVVLGVDAFPALTDGSPLLQQALHQDPPLLPHQLFRHLAKEALLAKRAAAEAAAAGAAGPSAAALYSGGGGGGAAGLGAEDFAPLGGAGGLGADVFGDADGGGGFPGYGAGGDAGADDAEAEGMSATYP